VVSILKDIVPPCATLMSVANPWMLESPFPVISQLLGLLPGFEFSHTISFAIAGLQPNV
jgi:hypothetical protein